MILKIRTAIIASLCAACLAPLVSNAGEGSGREQVQSMGNMKGMHDASLNKPGNWMFGYRYMNMEMKDLMAGSDKVSPETALNNSLYTNAAGDMYTTAPTSMTTVMHMLSAMYTYSDKLSAMVMLNYANNDMDMIMAMMPGDMPMAMNMDSSGIADTQFVGFYRMDGIVDGDLKLKLGLSLPTGSIDEKDTNGDVLPYSMQLGSGTYDLIPGFVMTRDYAPWGVGAEGSFTLRLSDNDQHYNLGKRINLTGWVARTITQGTQLKGVLGYTKSDAIEGQDARITDLMSISNDPRNYGGTQVDLSLGLSHALGHGHSVGIAYTLPVNQNLNGIQMATERMLALSWDYML